MWLDTINYHEITDPSSVLLIATIQEFQEDI